MPDLSKFTSGGASTALSPADPLSVAWKQFMASESFANSRKWAVHDEHLDGSLWNCFMVGWMASQVVERERCVAVVNAARHEEIDPDLRSIRGCIAHGYVPEDLRKERAATDSSASNERPKGT